jgi:hypothetical protein
LKYYKELNHDVIQALNYNEDDDGGLSKKERDRMSEQRDTIMMTLMEMDCDKRMLY